MISILRNIKKIRGFHDLMWQNGDPLDIIPRDSYWVFRWGYQSIRTVLSYRKIEALYKQGFEPNSHKIKKATKRYAADQFSCQFGQPKDEVFRNYIEEAKKAGVSEKELRSLICNNGIQSIKNNHMHIRKSMFYTIVGGAYIFLYIAAILAFSLIIILSTADLILKLSLFFIIWLVFFGCGFSVYLTEIKPIFIARRLNEKLREIWISFQKNKKPIVLSIVT